jgi:low temperature requirement protein LtrA
VNAPTGVVLPFAEGTGHGAALRYVARLDEERRVTWLELFFDLVFVAAVAQVAHPLRDHYTIGGLVRFAILFSDAAHLPERFGLFTIILLGESVIAVMHGIEHQEYWSVPAASAAFLGMATAFLLWWAYFHGARAASARPVRTTGDAVRPHVWSYAHLPFYLGLVVAFVGIERLGSESNPL